MAMTKDDIKLLLASITTLPGVYQMMDKDSKLLYVGKAKNLKKRVSSYFRTTGLSIKTRSLMNQVVLVETIVTETETEALILENNLIKKYHPKYNILLRDDKSYPYIQVTNEAYPRLRLYRGSRAQKGTYFGPYPSVFSVRETLDILQKVFLIRNCSNSFFKNRSRPCLQYQIKRCSAPCVNFVDQKTYQDQIDNATLFLQGKSNTLLSSLENKMLEYSEKEAYEAAIICRNQIQSLRQILDKQYITTANESKNADVIALSRLESYVVIQVIYIRSGQNTGSQTYYPKIQGELDNSVILQSFIEQIYFDKRPPTELILNTSLGTGSKDLLIDFFKTRFDIRVNINDKPRSYRAKWLLMAQKNAEITLLSKMESNKTLKDQFITLRKSLGLVTMPNLLACVDISHTMGDETVASYVVFNQDGAKKSDYRKYNIKDIKAGDDYAAIAQVIQRRFRRIKANTGQEKVPDILLIDGGIGQFNAAKKVLIEEGVFDQLLLVGVAKGSDRKAGLERLIVGQADNIVKLKQNDRALFLIQKIRDESHRFAILGHRKRRDKKQNQSILLDIEGIGEKRRQSLLKYFAGIKGVQSASIDTLQQVDGISPALAKKIYTYFHGT